MALPEAVQEHHRSLRRIQLVALTASRSAWSRMGADFDGSWVTLGPSLVGLVAAAQGAAARSGAAYVPTTLAEQGADVTSDAEVVPEAFAGVASDGRPLESLLYGAVTTAKESVAAAPATETVARLSGAEVAAALAAGGRWLEMTVQTQVADAARGAAGVAIAARPRVKWVRVVNPPCCGRCAALAGREYEYSQGFLRHPRCDCGMLPFTVASREVREATPLSVFDAMTPAQQDKAFTKAGAQAIRDGADPVAVVNARRGMAKAASGRARRVDVNGQPLYVTTEATTRGASASRVATGRRGPRLMPESIYEIAESREEAVRLLRLNGYLRP